MQLGGEITSKWSVCAHTPTDPATSPPHKTVRISAFSGLLLNEVSPKVSLFIYNFPPSASSCLFTSNFFLSFNSSLSPFPSLPFIWDHSSSSNSLSMLALSSSSLCTPFLSPSVLRGFDALSKS